MNGTADSRPPLPPIADSRAARSHSANSHARNGRARAAQAGQAAEAAVRTWLEARGLACIAANFRARVGELDLVMRDGDVVAIVEVRQRTHATYGGAGGSVHAFKQRRIVAATGRLLAQRPALANARLRFDVVAVEGEPPEWRFDWIRDAFRPY